jgi:hypothetical protein
LREPDQKIEPESSEALRKPYRKPRLIIYGDIREITQTLGTMGMDDGLTKTGLF